MLRKLGLLSDKEVAEFITQLEEHRTLLSPDASSYARGRQRFWLQHEWNLKLRCFQPALMGQKLWSICKQWMPNADLGLVVYGSVGIALHRDDSYAAYKAVGINLGEIEGWQYDCQYPEFRWTREKNPSNPRICRIPIGGVFEFNCKNPHSVLNPAKDRWAIFLWQVAGKYRTQFNKER